VTTSNGRFVLTCSRNSPRMIAVLSESDGHLAPRYSLPNPMANRIISFSHAERQASLHRQPPERQVHHRADLAQCAAIGDARQMHIAARVFRKSCPTARYAWRAATARRCGHFWVRHRRVAGSRIALHNSKSRFPCRSVIHATVSRQCVAGEDRIGG